MESDSPLAHLPTLRRPAPGEVSSANYVALAGQTSTLNLPLMIDRLTQESTAQLLHCVLGVTSEGGELAGELKAHLLYGTPLDWDHVVEELGDLLWYLAEGMRAVHPRRHLTMDQILWHNIDKVVARHLRRIQEGKLSAR